MKQIWPAPERNKGPILEVLRRVLPAEGTVLELASGTGQHVMFFSEQLPGLVFLPTDLSDENRASISAHLADSPRANVRPPRPLDVREGSWDLPPVDAILCANLIHIAPWECTPALFRGAAEVLLPGGLVVLYGPFRIGGEHTSESNAVFDADLRSRDPAYGVRDLEAVIDEAAKVGLGFEERIAMPANNQIALFRNPG